MMMQKLLLEAGKGSVALVSVYIDVLGGKLCRTRTTQQSGDH